MWNLLVVGAGPAGLKAAISAAESGLNVKVIDEFPKPGGRLLGQLYQKPDGKWWNGIELGEELYKEAFDLGVQVECEVSVYDISKMEGSWRIFTNKGDIQSDRLLLATGASEKAIPIPGWTLPGVMSIGAAQVMSNVHRVKPGDECVVIGVNVLSVSIAHELSLCGIKVKEIILPKDSTLSGHAGNPQKVLESLMKLTHLAPSLILRQLGKVGKHIEPKLAIHFFPKKGIEMFGIPIRIRTAALEIAGNTEVSGVKTVSVTAAGKVLEGTERFVDADFVCIAGGLTPLAELASIIGCEFEYVSSLGGHIPVHDERMRTTVKDLYVAGNITGIESANVAMAQGTVAGYAAAADYNKNWEQIESLVQEAIQMVRTTRREALIQFQPGIQEERKKAYDRNDFNENFAAKINV